MHSLLFGTNQNINTCVRLKYGRIYTKETHLFLSYRLIDRRVRNDTASLDKKEKEKERKEGRTRSCLIQRDTEILWGNYEAIRRTYELLEQRRRTATKFVRAQLIRAPCAAHTYTRELAG